MTNETITQDLARALRRWQRFAKDNGWTDADFQTGGIGWISETNAALAALGAAEEAAEAQERTGAMDAAAEQHAVDARFRAAGFVAAGGMWGDAQWKRLSPTLAVSVGQCYGPAEGRCDCEGKVERCEALMRPERFGWRCVVTTFRGALDQGWEPEDGEAPTEATLGWSDERVLRFRNQYGTLPGEFEALEGEAVQHLMLPSVHEAIQHVAALAREEARNG